MTISQTFRYLINRHVEDQEKDRNANEAEDTIEKAVDALVDALNNDTDSEFLSQQPQPLTSTEDPEQEKGMEINIHCSQWP